MPTGTSNGVTLGESESKIVPWIFVGILVLGCLTACSSFCKSEDTTVVTATAVRAGNDPSSTENQSVEITAVQVAVHQCTP